MHELQRRTVVVGLVLAALCLPALALNSADLIEGTLIGSVERVSSGAPVSVGAEIIVTLLYNDLTEDLNPDALGAVGDYALSSIALTIDGQSFPPNMVFDTLFLTDAELFGGKSSGDALGIGVAVGRGATKKGAVGFFASLPGGSGLFTGDALSQVEPLDIDDFTSTSWSYGGTDFRVSGSFDSVNFNPVPIPAPTATLLGLVGFAMLGMNGFLRRRLG